MKFLPPNWKKFDLQSLKDLYADTCVEFYNLPDDGHWARYRKSELIVKLEIFQDDKAAEEADNPTSDFQKETNPVCPKCRIPMMERQNRLTKEPFYGCYFFPSCKETLPFIYDKTPVGQVEKMIDQEKVTAAKSKAAAKKMAKRTAPSDGEATGSDASSWMMMVEPNMEGQINVNLSEEEMTLIQEMRDKQPTQ